MMLSVSQVAAELNVSTETVRRWIKSGTLRGTKLKDENASRGRWRVYPESLREFIESGEPEPGVIDPHAPRSRLMAVEGSLRERSRAA